MILNSDVRLYKLQVASGDIDSVVNSSSSAPKYYEFEITNMTEAELNPPPPKTEGAADANAQPQDANAQQDQKKSSGLKPLFGAKQDSQSQQSAQPGQPAQPGATQPANTGSNNGLPPNLEEIKKF